MKSLKILALLLAFTASTAHAASVTGTVTYDGKIPKFREIKMDADPICLTHHEGAVYPQTLLLGDGQTMGNVFVHIVSGLPKKDYPAPTEPAVLTQEGCMYTPHVIGVMVNQPVKILNPDGTLHNVHAVPKKNAEFNLAMPKFRKEMTQTFTKAEFMFPMKCDVHPWMGAWVSVMDHPYFMVTQTDGKYTIDNLPAGEYKIEVWHEKLGPQQETFTVAEGETKTLDFTFTYPSQK
ncbi:MAG: carboxypeptidase regulatory-like domain-containing protein [Candidatus Omnitrophica bacterium]|nr:carboxypeptidase regulatory-like domain-containing protein [Candidatus Omnitrophota bacterium]